MEAGPRHQQLARVQRLRPRLGLRQFHLVQKADPRIHRREQERRLRERNQRHRARQQGVSPSPFERGKQPAGAGGRPQPGATTSPAGAPVTTPVQSFRPSPPPPKQGQPHTGRFTPAPKPGQTGRPATPHPRRAPVKLQVRPLLPALNGSSCCRTIVSTTEACSADRTRRCPRGDGRRPAWSERTRPN